MRTFLKLTLIPCLFLSPFFCAIAYAQDVPLPLPANSDTATTVWGWVLRGLLLLVLALVGWGVKGLGAFITSKTNQQNQGAAQTFFWSVLNKVWIKAQASGGKIIAKERLLLEKILADGKVTPEEFAMLKSAIVADLREIASEDLPALKSVLGLGTEGALTGILDGFASKVAHSFLVRNGGDLSTSVAPAQVVVMPPTGPVSPR